MEVFDNSAKVVKDDLMGKIKTGDKISPPLPLQNFVNAAMRPQTRCSESAKPLTQNRAILQNR